MVAESIKTEIDKNDIELINEIKNLNRIHTSWRDYCLIMLNSTAEPLRSIWREKIVTSLTHWEFNSGSISDGNIAGIEILTVLPSTLTQFLVDDHFEKDGWHKLERLNRSKRMNVFVGHYGQESFSNEANICIKYLVQNWNNHIPEADNKTGEYIIKHTALLRSIWGLAQKSGGKCINDDELLTYILEKPVDDSRFGIWVEVADDIFANGIPSETYRKYWKNDKIEGYPLAEYIDDSDNWFSRKVLDDGTVELSELSLEEQKKNFLSVCDIFLKENVAWAACYKKICICILKNDVSMKYCGFGATLRERKAREDAMAAFSTKQEEKLKAKENAEALAKKIEKENMENNR